MLKKKAKKAQDKKAGKD